MRGGLALGGRVAPASWLGHVLGQFVERDARPTGTGHVVYSSGS